MGASTRVAPQSGVPRLEPGITRLRGERGTAGLHRLVATALATATGPAYWVDAGNEAAPRALFRAATDRLSLARLRVARAFTAYQHHALIEALVDRVDEDTSLVVASSLPALYADDDLLAGEGTRLFRAGVKRLLRLRRRLDVPVLVTHAPTADDGFAGLLGACADQDVEAVETDCGVRFVGDGVRTTGYDAGLLDQATLTAFADADVECEASRLSADVPRPVADARRPLAGGRSGDRPSNDRLPAARRPADRRVREEVRA